MPRYKKIAAAFMSAMLAAGINTSICCADHNGYRTETHVTMTYNENGKTPVIIRYIDEDGNIIADSCAIFGQDGDAYEVSAIQIQGYELKEIKGNKKGVIGKDDTVTFVYKKVKNDTNKDEDNKENHDNNKNNLNFGQNNGSGNNHPLNNNMNPNTNNANNNKNSNILIKDISNIKPAADNDNAAIKVKTGDSYLSFWITAIGAAVSGVTGLILYGRHKKGKYKSVQFNDSKNNC